MNNLTGRPRVDALVFAGGTGARMTGSTVPKQFLKFGGRELILYTLDKFNDCQQVDGVTIVCLEAWMDALKVMIDREGYRVPIKVVLGGDTGQRSRLNGINAIYGANPNDEEAIVLVHDAVRPLVTEDAITDCIASVIDRGCTTVTAPAIETIAVVSGDGRVQSLQDRSRCRLARAPQGFRAKQLWDRYNQAEREGLEFVDSVSLMAHYGYEIYAVEGPAENIKVTTPTDYFAFKGMMDMVDLSQLWNEREAK